ncbi:hypothetical protein C8Q77DRAFT_905583 [Trametes polyzona]|nr:hypothetical protein C8Q77DRAFT_905583 [Trametes polyzona]
MALTDVLNTTRQQFPSTTAYTSSVGRGIPSKRPLENGEFDGVEIPPSPKRPRVLDDSLPTPPTYQVPIPKPVTSLPDPCNTFIQLRFQLCRFKGVYRVALIPLSFTFAHLYRYILFLFGWSGRHIHEFEVYSHVELYSKTWRPGEIKRHRSCRFPEAPDPDKNFDAWSAWLTLSWRAEEDPVLRMGPYRCMHDAALAYRRPLPPANQDNPWDKLLAQVQVPYRYEKDVTLGDVWSRHPKQNISGGKCANPELAVKFKYDPDANWEVHITVDPENDGQYMWTTSVPSSRPELISARGAPPSENPRKARHDIEPKHKVVPYILLRPESFERYLKGELTSVVGCAELFVQEKGRPRKHQTTQPLLPMAAARPGQRVV